MEDRPVLEDGYGRTFDSLRISITRRCNFDCFYCHNEGLGETRSPRAPEDDEMSADHAVEIAAAARRLGVRDFKLTGGEPMLRSDLEKIVAGISRLPDSEVSLTTNGVFLDGRAQDLSERGLERVNVSMDTPDPDAFREITRGALDPVYSGVEAAVDAGLTPVKLNMVLAEPMRPYVWDMVDLVSGYDGVELQLIEYMSTLSGESELHVDPEEIERELEMRAESVETREVHHRRRYHVGGCVVEIVDPVDNPDFCANCTRLRVTPDGTLKGCLNHDEWTASTVDTTASEMERKFREVVDQRVPYYGEYLVESETGDWNQNPDMRPDLPADD